MKSPSPSTKLPAWGPYSKRYIGISHVPDVSAGLRFDLSVFPGLYRREAYIPNVRYDSGYMPVAAAPDLSYYRIRHGMPEIRELYCDIDYCRIDGATVLIRAEFVNKTPSTVNAELHQMASVHFPPLAPNFPEAVRIARVDLPVGAVWIDALLDYTGIHETTLEPRTHLPWSGRRRGEFGGHGFVDGQGLGAGVLGKPGDVVRYARCLDHEISNPYLLIRYKLPPDEKTVLHCDLAEDGRIVLHGTDGFGIARARIREPLKRRIEYSLESTTEANLQLDGFVVCGKADLGKVSFIPVQWQPKPEIRWHDRSLVLTYPDFPHSYGIAWDHPHAKVRQFLSSELDHVLRETKHDHVSEILKGDGNGHFSNLFMRPVSVAAHSSKVLYSLLVSGPSSAVAERLASFNADDPKRDALHAEFRRCALHLDGNPSGEPFRASQQRMAANVLTGIVYPVKRRSRWIKHYTPGRWWDCLYTWDAGFTALGLAELDPERAAAHIATYLTGPEDPDKVAFVHYGTPVPTQFHAFHALQQIRPDAGRIREFYHRFVPYHRFLAGRHGSSTTARLKSGLLTTWDYFYNSGGWDDYPPQVHVHKSKLTDTVAPVANTAHAIRTARLLKAWAEDPGETVQEFDADIERLGSALQEHAWDEEAGVFSYVTHDKEGHATGILKHGSGSNYNHGLDGFMTLVADICTPGQEERLVNQLFDENRYWTPVGLSTVDQSAPYYTPDGYWNGAVWMPHQWFIWKALLDCGRADEAFKIATTALRLWRDEVTASGRCFEHFIVAGGRGAGWHQFGGLSCPVLNWYGAYHRPGRLTGGLNLLVDSLEILPATAGLNARIRVGGQSRHSPVLLAVLLPDRDYQVQFNGNRIVHHVRHPGTLEFALPAGNPSGELKIRSTS
ncbi:MAG: MGH1-like glycoside hydrolase domain-containing protein [Oceanipulchritudo sp.]